MFDSIDLIVIAKALGIVTLASTAFAVLAFVFQWGFRFRMVGVSSFMALITIGVFALNLSLYQRVAIPGAEQFSLVYDNGGDQVVIAIKPAVINADSLQATLEQAANDLYSPGRLGRGAVPKMTIRARVILHPEPGISEPLYVGQVKRTLGGRTDENMEIEIYPQAIARIPTQPV